MDPESHVAMVNAIVDIFWMSNEEKVSYFKHKENMETIRRTNSLSTLPVSSKNL
jgi:FtsZ-interacting cell division protein ZipA